MTQRSRRYQRIAGASALLVIGALTVGCGSSSGGSGGSGGQIVVGALGSYSGLNAGTFGGIPQVLQAWASTVNAAGGIDGKQVKVITDDIGQSTTAGPAAAHQLIDQDHVVAIIDNLDANDGVWGPYAASKGIPVLDGTEDATSLTDPNHFNPFTSDVAASVAIADVAKASGGKIGVAYCAESPSCASSVELFKGFEKLLDVTVTTAADVPASTADFTAVCQQIKDGGATVTYNSLAPALATRMLDTCYQQGVRAKPILYGQGATPQWKTDKVYAGSEVIDYVAPYFDTAIPGVSQYRAALAKYAPSVIGTSEDNSYGLAAWGSAQLFAASLAHTSGPVTSAAVKRGLYSLKGETLGGITAPVTFTAGKPTNSDCYFVWKITAAGTFSPGSSVAPTCIPDAIVSPILQAVLAATKSGGQ